MLAESGGGNNLSSVVDPIVLMARSWRPGWCRATGRIWVPTAGTVSVFAGPLAVPTHFDFLRQYKNFPDGPQFSTFSNCWNDAGAPSQSCWELAGLLWDQNQSGNGEDCDTTTKDYLHRMQTLSALLQGHCRNAENLGEIPTWLRHFLCGDLAGASQVALKETQWPALSISISLAGHSRETSALLKEQLDIWSRDDLSPAAKVALLLAAGCVGEALVVLDRQFGYRPSWMAAFALFLWYNNPPPSILKLPKPRLEAAILAYHAAVDDGIAEGPFINATGHLDARYWMIRQWSRLHQQPLIDNEGLLDGDSRRIGSTWNVGRILHPRWWGSDSEDWSMVWAVMQLLRAQLMIDEETVSRVSSIFAEQLLQSQDSEVWSHLAVQVMPSLACQLDMLTAKFDGSSGDDNLIKDNYASSIYHCAKASILRSRGSLEEAIGHFLRDPRSSSMAARLIAERSGPEAVLSGDDDRLAELLESLPSNNDPVVAWMLGALQRYHEFIGFGRRDEAVARRLAEHLADPKSGFQSKSLLQRVCIAEMASTLVASASFANDKSSVEDSFAEIVDRLPLPEDQRMGMLYRLGRQMIADPEYNNNSVLVFAHNHN